MHTCIQLKPELDCTWVAAYTWSYFVCRLLQVQNVVNVGNKVRARTEQEKNKGRQVQILDHPVVNGEYVLAAFVMVN
jgi:hypothetical protein